jgi:hypothetical protein
MWFWDERTGVFVTGPQGTVSARSRVFAEIGAAQWCSHLEEEELRAWVDAAVRDRPQRTALLLASQTDPRVFPLLVDHPLIAAEALQQGARATNEQSAHLLEQIVSLCELTTTGKIGENTNRLCGHAIQLLAELPLGEALNTRRIEALQSLMLSHEHRTCALAIAATSTAKAERRQLAPAEVGAVTAMLALPLLGPDTSVPQTRDGVRHFAARTRLHPGMAEAITQASEHVRELPEGAVDRITSLVSNLPTRNASTTAANLAAAGYGTGFGEALNRLHEIFDPHVRQLLANFEALLGATSRLSTTTKHLSPQQRWRLPTLHAFLHTLHFSTTTELNELDDITHDLTESWLRTAALAAGLDLETLAAEARSCTPDAVRNVLELACVPLPREDDTVSLDRLDEEARASLPALLSCNSDWMANTAIEILWECTDSNWFPVIAKLIADAAPPRRHDLAELALSLSSDPTAQAALYLASTDPPLRRAAAAWLDDSNPLRQLALCDPDACVRIAAGAPLDDQSGSPPKYWCCLQCTAANEMSSRWCAACGHHSPFILHVRSRSDAEHSSNTKHNDP